MWRQHKIRFVLPVITKMNNFHHDNNQFESKYVEKMTRKKIIIVDISVGTTRFQININTKITTIMQYINTALQCTNNFC